MWIKICGITNPEDAMAAVALGADAIGLVFADSPRKVSPARAKEICEAALEGAVRVGVFMNQEFSTVCEISRFCNLDMVQLHGDENEEYSLRVGKPVIKAFRANHAPELERMKAYPAEIVLLEDVERFHPSVSGLLAERKVVLAGGLNPANVEAVVQSFGPFGVDVASGVERLPGVKDHELVKLFIERARKAQRVDKEER